MNTDIRLHITFWGHHKTKRLKSALGSDGIESLLKLWLWTAQNRPSGVLTSMDTRDIELVSDWNGIEGEFFKTCHDIGWIDDSDGKSRTFEIHDWRVWNPYAAAEDERRSQGRLAKLAQANKEAYQACASAGIRELSADEYQQLKPLHGQALCDCVTSIQSAQSDSSASNSGRRAPAQRRNSGATAPQARRNIAADAPQQQERCAGHSPQKMQGDLPAGVPADCPHGDHPTAGNHQEIQTEEAGTRPHININQGDSPDSPYSGPDHSDRSADAQRPLARPLAPLPDPLPDREERSLLSPHPTDFEVSKSPPVSEGGGNGNAEAQVSPEFKALRKIYDSVRTEAPLTGVKAYVALKKSGKWPGLEYIKTALRNLSEKDYQWLNGTAPGLEKFLSEGWWTIEPRPSPPVPKIRGQGQNAGDRNALSRKNAETASRVLEDIHSEISRK